MTGPDYDPEYEPEEPEEFGPAPHPDDRLWRHPSEVAAMQAAHANADTAKMPAIQIVAADQPRSRFQVGLMVAAGVVAVGAAALTLGVMSGGGTNGAQSVSEVAGILPTTGGSGSVTGSSSIANTEAAMNGSSDGEQLLASRVHDEVATSLPRVQAATANGMKEGSGLFITDDGYIATSAGLIDNADYVLAWTEDGQRWKAHVIASDPVSDVAIIQIDSGNWPAVSLGSGTELWSGQYALALDHEDNTISLGEVTTVTGPLVGIDQPAAMPGSAIVDDTGAVIAMVTADGTNRYATPAWMLEQVTVDLIASGETNHVWLGVVVESDQSEGDMVRVLEVIDESPAHDAGLRPGDLIDSFNGTAVTDAATLHRQVQAGEAGNEAVLTVTRNDSRRIILATLAALPE